jgi:TAP42-like family
MAQQTRSDIATGCGSAEEFENDDPLDLPLSVLFARGYAAYRGAEEGSASQVRVCPAPQLACPVCASVSEFLTASLCVPCTSLLQAQLHEGVASLRQASNIARQLSLFSRNEEADDVATTDLKFLLLPFLLAQARSKRTAFSTRTRI